MELYVKEIKFLSHTVRNFYLYIILFYIYYILYSIQLSVFSFVFGLITYTVAYAPVYFFNDYTDWKEDKKYGKYNLYLSIKNKKLYWAITIALIFFGVLFSYLISKLALFILIVLYFLNYLYSFKPFRLRDRVFLREIAIFFIYGTKVFLISECLHYNLNQGFPLLIFLLVAVSGSLGISLYKRYKKRYKLYEYIFGLIFTILWTATVVSYKRLFLFLFPVLPTALWMWISYKNQKIPIGKIQTFYFLYTTVIFFYSLM